MYDQCLLCHGNCSPHRIFDVLPCLLISSGAWCIIELRTALWKHIESKLLHTTQIFLIKQPRPNLIIQEALLPSFPPPTCSVQCLKPCLTLTVHPSNVHRPFVTCLSNADVLHFFTGLLQKQQSAAFMLTMASRTRRSTTICMLLEHTVDAAHMPPR